MEKTREKTAPPVETVEEPREKLPTVPVIPKDDIVDPKVLAQYMKAAAQQKQLVDTPDNRATLAQAVQDHVIALRQLGCVFNAGAVCVWPGGDLYVFGQPCHPRSAGAKLAAALNVADLTDLVAELKEKLDYEAS